MGRNKVQGEHRKLVEGRNNGKKEERIHVKFQTSQAAGNKQNNVTAGPINVMR